MDFTTQLKNKRGLTIMALSTRPSSYAPASLLALQTLSDEGAATLPFSFLCALSALSDGCGITPANAATKSVFVSDGTSPTGCVVLQVRR